MATIVFLGSKEGSRLTNYSLLTWEANEKFFLFTVMQHNPWDIEKKITSTLWKIKQLQCGYFERDMIMSSTTEDSTEMINLSYLGKLLLNKIS